MSSRLAAHSYYLTGVTVEGVMKRQFLACGLLQPRKRIENNIGMLRLTQHGRCLWHLLVDGENDKRTTMAVNNVNILPTLSGMAVYQHTVRAQFEVKKRKKVISLVV